MRLPLLVSVLAASIFAAAPGAAPVEALYLSPLDTAVVTLDSSLRRESLDALDAPPSGALARRASTTPEGQVARSFHPLFGEAIARAARKVEAIDSTSAGPRPAPRSLRFARGRDTLLFRFPAPVADSARYLLVVGSLTLKESYEHSARRFVPPTEPEFDPTMGAVRPGNRKGYIEGPGRFTRLEARAEWLIWDEVTGTATRRGVATGKASARGEPTRAQWEELARALAKDVLKRTAFSP